MFKSTIGVNLFLTGLLEDEDFVPSENQKPETNLSLRRLTVAEALADFTLGAFQQAADVLVVLGDNQRAA